VHIFDLLPDPLSYNFQYNKNNENIDGDLYEPHFNKRFYKGLICDIIGVLEYLNYNPESMAKFCRNKNNNKYYNYVWSYIGDFDTAEMYDEIDSKEIDPNDLDVNLPGIYKNIKNSRSSSRYIPIEPNLTTTCILPSWKSRYSLNNYGFLYKSDGFELNFKDFDKKLESLTQPWLTDFPWETFKTVCLTGGTMLNAVSNLEEDPYQDIDLFVGGDDPEHAKQVVKDLLYYFKDKFKMEFIYSIKKSVITMYLVGCSKPLQIIVINSGKPDIFLDRFDISCVKIYKDYTGSYINVCTYFELMRGFMEIYEPLLPARLRKYMKKGLSVVSKSPFVIKEIRTSPEEDNNTTSYLIDGVVDVDLIIKCRNLEIEESIKWYPTENNIKFNLGMTSRILQNTINRVHNDIVPIINMFEFGDLNVLGGYKGTQYHLGFLDSLPISRIPDIPFKIINNEKRHYRSKYGNYTQQYDMIHISPIMFWINGKFNVTHDYDHERNATCLNIKFPRNIANEISIHVNNKLRETITELYPKYTTPIIVFHDDRNKKDISWLNIKVDSSDKNKVDNKKDYIYLSVSARWDSIIGIDNGRTLLSMKPTMVNFKYL